MMKKKLNAVLIALMILSGAGIIGSTAILSSSGGGDMQGHQQTMQMPQQQSLPGNSNNSNQSNDSSNSSNSSDSNSSSSNVTTTSSETSTTSDTSSVSSKTSGIVSSIGETTRQFSITLFVGSFLVYIIKLFSQED